MWHLWVRPSARGEGCARRLMRAVSERALAEAGIAPAALRVCADVLNINVAALAFWRHVLEGGIDDPAEDYVRVSGRFASSRADDATPAGSRSD